MRQEGVVVARQDTIEHQLQPRDWPSDTLVFRYRQAILHPVPVLVTVYATGDVVTHGAADFLRFDGTEWDVHGAPGRFGVN